MSGNRNLRGALLMLLGVGLLSLMDGGIKVLAQHYPPMQVAALRSTSSLPLAVMWVALTVGFRSLLRVRWPLHLLRGAIGVTMIACFAYGLRVLPMSTAYTLFFVAPLVITLLSGPVLGETVGWRRWLVIVGGLAGTLVVLRPSSEGLLSWPALAVLGSATGYAIAAVTVRVLGRTDSTQSIVFWLLLIASIGAGALAAPGWVAIRGEHWPVIAAVGFCGALGQYAITEAFSRGEASVIAPLEYSALAWGVAMDWAIWHTLPDRYTIVGATIIIASGLYLLRRTRDEESFKP